MKKSLTVLVIALLMFSIVSATNAAAAILVEQGSVWQYSVLDSDLWTDWNNVNYSSFDWNSSNWKQGNAVFGNKRGDYSTYWSVNTDLALQQAFHVDGKLAGPATLKVTADNGFIVFINGQEVARENEGGYAYYWEYTYTLPLADPRIITSGQNIIEVFAEDHGGKTFFDLELTGNVAPVPIPGSLFLLSTGLIALAGAKCRKNCKKES